MLKKHFLELPWNKIHVVLKQHMFWFPCIKFREPSFSLLLCHWPPCQWHLSLCVFSVYMSRCMHEIRKKLGIRMKLPAEKRRKKFGSENKIKLNLSCREAVKCFQIVGEKKAAVWEKIPYLCNHFWLVALLFCLANSRQYGVHHSNIMDYLPLLLLFNYRKCDFILNFLWSNLKMFCDRETKSLAEE